MTAAKAITICALTILLSPYARAEQSGQTYALTSDCERKALIYYDNTERSKNIDNNSTHYESYIESGYNFSENICYAHISSMTSRHKDGATVWAERLVNIDADKVIGSLRKSNAQGGSQDSEFTCTINSEECSSKSEFKALARQYMGN